ncbi:MAG: ABC transporter substrate-binding protein [Solirubrobacterales bacterium]
MTKARRTFIGLACGVLALGALAAGCGDDDSGSADTAGTAASTEPIVIGLANAQTGFFGYFDVTVSNAVKLAAEQINAAGGVDGRRITTVESDAKSDPNQSAAAAIDVIDQGADVVVTMCDYDLGAPAAREAVKRDKLALACAGSPLFGSKGIGPLAFSVNEGTPTQGTVGGEFAVGQGYKTAYLLKDTSNEYTQTWCDAFEAAFTTANGDGAIVGEDTFVTGDTTVASQVSRLRSSGTRPDVIALCGYPPTGTTAIKQIRDAGIDTPIVSTAGFDGPGWLDAVPKASEVYAVVSGSIYGDDPSEAINQFVADYTAKYGAPSSAYLLYGQAMAESVQLAAQDAGSSDGPALATAMEGFTDAPLTIGPTTFTPDCHIALGRPMQIVQYQNGKGSWKETVTPADVPVPAECAP